MATPLSAMSAADDPLIPATDQREQVRVIRAFTLSSVQMSTLFCKDLVFIFCFLLFTTCVSVPDYIEHLVQMMIPEAHAC